MTNPNASEIVSPDGAPSPQIIDQCAKAEASRDEAGDDPLHRRRRGAQEAAQSIDLTIDATIDRSIAQRSQGAGEVAPDGGPDGISSSPNIEAEDVAGDDRGLPLDPVESAITDPLPVRFPLPESNPNDTEMAENRHPDRESNQGLWQTPATRSTFSQRTEKPPKSAKQQAELRHRCTKVSYLDAAKSRLTLSNRSRNRRQNCSTRSSHLLSSRGLWLRGSMSK